MPSALSRGSSARCAESQTPLGERVPSAVLGTVCRALRLCLKPLSGNVCLRPESLPHCRSEGVSNPSRGTCAFGRLVWRTLGLGAVQVSNPSRGTCAFGPRRGARSTATVITSQTPLGERVPSAVIGSRVRHTRARSVSNPSRGTCAFGRGSSARCAEHCDCGLKPLSGNVCLRPVLVFHHGEWWNRVSNPSRGTCAFGPCPGCGHVKVLVVSNPSRGTCAFGRAPTVAGNGHRRSLKPLSGNVCLRPLWRPRPSVAHTRSQTPLGERVPSARYGAETQLESLPHVSNPSRGTCAFGPNVR